MTRTERIKKIAEALGWRVELFGDGKIREINSPGVSIGLRSFSLHDFLAIATCELAKHGLHMHREMYGGGRPAVWFWDESNSTSGDAYFDPTSIEESIDAQLSAMCEAVEWIEGE